MVDALPDVWPVGPFHGDELSKRLISRLLDAFGDHVHRLVQGDLFPVAASRSAIQGPGAAQGIDRELETRRPLSAERAAIDGAIGVALDIDDLAVLDTHEHATAHRAVGTDTRDLFDTSGLEALRTRLGRAHIYQGHNTAHRETARRNCEE